MTASFASDASRGGVLVASAQGAKIFVHFASVIVLARLIAPEAFGLVAMAMAVVGLADVLRDAGLLNAAIQSKELSHAQASNLFWVNIAVGVGLASCVALVAYPLSVLYGDIRLVAVVFAVAPIYLFNAVSTQFRVQLLRDFRFGTIAVLDIAPVVVGLGVAVALAISGAEYWALVWQQLSTAATAMVASAALSRWWPGQFSRGVGTTRFIRYGLQVTAMRILGYAAANADTVVLGVVLGAHSTGIYSRAYQLVMAPISKFTHPLTSVALPVLSRAFHEGRDLGSYLRKAQVVACYGTVPLLFLGASQAGVLIPLVLGSGWESSIPIFVILCLGAAFRAVLQISYWGYMAAGQPRLRLRVSMVANPLMIIAIVFGGVWHGLMGTAWAVSIAYAGYWAASTLMMGRHLGISVRPLIGDAARAFLLIGVPIGAFGAWIASHSHSGVASLAVSALVSIAWVLVCWLVSPSVRRDLGLLARVAREGMRRSQKG